MAKQISSSCAVKINLSESLCVVSHILISPCGGRALTGNAHARALFTATLIVTLKIVESHFTAVAILSLHIFLKERKRERERET